MTFKFTLYGMKVPKIFRKLSSTFRCYLLFCVFSSDMERFQNDVLEGGEKI